MEEFFFTFRNREKLMGISRQYDEIIEKKILKCV